jgi:membrane associated rhomboid family serine protease
VRHREPIFNAPGIVVVLLALLVLVHIIRALLPETLDDQLVAIAAVVPARYGDAAANIPGGRIPAITSLVTHMLLHGDLIHLMINCAWLLVFGTIVARRVGAVRFVALTLVTGIAGAAAFILPHLDLRQPMIGCSGAVSGLMGATLRLMMPAMNQGGLALLRDRPDLVRVPTLMSALSDRRMLLWIGLVVALNLLSTIGFGGGAESGTLAWEAHLGGFFLGILGFGLFDRQPRPALNATPPRDDDRPPLRPTLH